MPAEKSFFPALFVFALAACLAACDEPNRQPTAREPASALDVGIAAIDNDVKLPGSVRPTNFVGLADDLAVDESPGLSFITLDSADPARSVLIAAIDNRHFEPAILARRNGKLNASRALRREDIQLVIGSGFVSEFQSAAPLGLLTVEGKVLSDISIHGYTRILGTRRHELAVVGRSEYQSGSLESALQVGPGIIESGRLDISERELALTAYIRAFVALCGPQTLAGITRSPRHLHDLGRQLLEFANEASLQCSEVVNLSGDREAILAARRSDGVSYFHFGDHKSSKAALVGFRRVRETSAAR